MKEIYSLLNAQPCAFNLVNKTNSGALFLLVCLFYYSLHVSGNYVPIIRIINCINATPGICHTV